ncbi:MAG: bacterial regulatory, arsR family protein [Paenibacillaceae bacterium]|jgi:DNA-binding transcriptional ArsR family regulator|nr:bacterial regulatory, arsR family protein [Paenibacillaceae bacterium]
MEQMMLINNRDQLKIISDPLRVKILMLLIEKEYTGQNISELLDISRANIHYHLKALEKVGFIELKRTEEKNGIIQKFYRAVAKSYLPGENLFPYAQEIISSANRVALLNTMDRIKERLINAPDHAFYDFNILVPIMIQSEMKLTKEKFDVISKKINDLYSELNELEKMGQDDPNAKWYYFGNFGFEVTEPFFRLKE